MINLSTSNRIKNNYIDHKYNLKEKISFTANY